MTIGVQKKSKAQAIPSLVTIANGICGFFAIYNLMQLDLSANLGSHYVMSTQNIDRLYNVCGLVVLGMIFDAFDGLLARMMGVTSSIGAQLDSMCDLVSFGVVPTVLLFQLSKVFSGVWYNLSIAFTLIYFIACLLRLAKFNADLSKAKLESPEDDRSAYKYFDGLPTPAAAGTIISIVFLYCYLARFSKPELQNIVVYKSVIQSYLYYLIYALPAFSLVLGVCMIYFKTDYLHPGKWLTSKEMGIELLGTILIICVVIVMFPEIIFPIMFISYLIEAPLRYGFKVVSGASSKKQPHHNARVV